RWLEIALPEPAQIDMVWYAQGIGQADRIHRSYGFSEFTLETARRTYRIGRIGERLFRAMDPAVLSDHVACCALASLDPRRRLLCIGPADSFADDLAEGPAVRARAIRMAGDADTIVKSLAAFRAF
ncbi:MAG: hypothetical protein HUU20_27665, partial [Pirellulales bacterium]|nr:hypothetical protein [Pirellulales bacterium]